MNNRKVSNWFRTYKKYKIDEFHLEGGGRADTLMIDKRLNRQIKMKDNRVHVLPYNFINKLSPNKIDSSFFWKKATEIFPLASISFSENCKDKNELNNASLENCHKACGAILALDTILSSNSSAKILEIGPGHGSVTNYIALNHNLNNYYAIDVYPLFKFSRLYKTDGKTIPNEVPSELDVVYAVNVFQHLSPEQRLSYYKQIKNKLAIGGKFIFSMFVVDSTNEKIIIKEKGASFSLYSFRDSKGNYYTNFFSQLTKCNRIEELQAIFKELSMDFKVISIHRNHYTMIATKI